MNPDMTTKLNRIKSALRESIEIASKATEGPWTYGVRYLACPSNDMEVAMIPHGQPCHAGNPWMENAKFLSHARTMTPLACKALLTAIEGLEELAETVDVEAPDEVLRAYEQDTEIAREALSSITSEWPDV
jgi:hypothetical protein